MDLLLSAFIRSTEEPESDRLLGELIVVHATPYIRRTLRQRLGLHVGQSGANPNNPQAEDLYQDAVTKVVQWLNDLKIKPEQKTVRNFGQYVSRIASNVCNDYLREKAPARYRLKNNLRDLFENRSEFSLWKDSSNSVVCGFRMWSAKQHSDRRKRTDSLEENIETIRAMNFPETEVNGVPLPEIVAAILNWIGGPIELDRLVNAAAQLLNLKEQTEESLDDDRGYWDQRLVDSAINTDSLLEQRESFQTLWKGIKQLPKRQRQAVCLSFQCEDGTDLVSLLLDTDLLTFDKIAAALAVHPVELLAIWKQMPMDNATVAAYVGATREQVNKWRFRVFKKLAKNFTALATKK